MIESLEPYGSAMLALGTYGALYLVQLVVADVAAIRAGHIPGTPVEGGHDDFLFRAARAHANSTESVGAVLLVSAFAISVGGDAKWLTNTLWVFVACRVVHMFAYYFDVRLLRSAAFGLGLTALFVMFGIGVRSL